jgi:hypothetical protein
MVDLPLSSWITGNQDDEWEKMRIQSNWYSWDDVVSTEMMYESLRDPFKWKYSNIVQNPLRTPDILSD